MKIILEGNIRGKMNIKEIKKDIKERLWGSKLEYFEVIEVK